MKTEEQLKDLAKQCIRNEIYVATTKEQIENSFMVLLAMGANYPKDTVALYSEYTKALPRALNGYPMFMECGFLRKEEYEIFYKYWQKYNEALND